MSKAFTIIEESCLETMRQGIKLVRGPAFDWTGPGELPLVCNWAGAVLWVSGVAHTTKPVTELCRILDVDGFWLYRCWIGWDGNLVLTATDPKTLKESKDEVSRTAQTLAKRLIRGRRPR
jgi:hypothetical protein